MRPVLSRPIRRSECGAAGTALACGYLLLTAFFMGSIFKSLDCRASPAICYRYHRRPACSGPGQPADGINLQIFNGVATALIALTAGVELDLRSIGHSSKASIGLAVAVCGTIAHHYVTVFLAS